MDEDRPFDDGPDERADEGVDGGADEPEKEPWHKGPIRVILAVFLVLIVLMMSIPYYAVKLDPEPVGAPSFDEMVPAIPLETVGNGTVPEKKSDYYVLVNGSDPVVKLVADRVVTSACKEAGRDSRICYAKALFYFVRDEFDYVNDPLRYEFVKGPRQSLASRGGDCDDASVLLASLLDAIGIETEFVFVPGHVYIQAYMPEASRRYRDGNGWVSLDATCNYCGFGQTSIHTSLES